MGSGVFMELISSHYDNIVSMFKSRLYGMGMQFDEDSFGEAFIKCHQKFGDNIITYETAIKYFWTVYINTVKTLLSVQTKYDVVSIDTIEDLAEDNSGQYAIRVYNKVMDVIEAEFGYESMMVYNLYKYHNWSINDLETAGYDCTDLSNRIKCIHKFIKTYCKQHKKSL